MATELDLRLKAVAGAAVVDFPAVTDATAEGGIGLPTFDAGVRSRLPATLDGDGGIKVHVQSSVPVTGSFFQATQPVSGSVSVSNFPATQAVSAASLPLPAGAATETTLASQSSAFARLLKFEPSVGEELRADETTTDRYHGSAPDGTAEATATWNVTRFYKDASDNIVRVRFRTGVAWSSRTVGW